MQDPREILLKLITEMAQNLVDQGEGVRVEMSDANPPTIFYFISCAGPDVAKLIGAQGATVYAMRKIVQCVAAKHKVKAMLIINT